VKPKPFLSLVTSNQNIEQVVNRLINDLSNSYEREKLLVRRLDGLINRKFRKKIFFPLFQKLNDPLRRIMIKQYSRFRPLDLPDQFHRFLMAYEGSHFADLLQLYLASNDAQDLEDIEQRLHFLGLRYGSKYRISHARVLFRLGRLGEAFYKVEAAVDVIRNKFKDKNIDPFTRYADWKNFSESEHRDILELCEMSGKIALLQGNGVLATKRLALLFHHPYYRGVVFEDLINALLEQNSYRKALEVIRMASLDDFEDPNVHLLRAKVLLYSDHHRAAKKHWLIARSLGAYGKLYEEVSFLVSHYYEREVSSGEQGEFASISSSLFPKDSELSLDFYQMRMFVLQYEKLKRHNPQILKKLKGRYVELPIIIKS
tara:strand:- start:1159 stop:2274 length:1116 start_codon:yes stop_codon:yes gene_type:complete